MSEANARSAMLAMLVLKDGMVGRRVTERVCKGIKRSGGERKRRVVGMERREETEERRG